MKVEYRFVTAGVLFMAASAGLCLAIGPAKASPPPVVVTPVRVTPVYVPVRTATVTPSPKPVQSTRVVPTLNPKPSNISKAGQDLVPSYRSSMIVIPSFYYAVALDGEVESEFQSYEDCVDNSDTEVVCIKGTHILND